MWEFALWENFVGKIRIKDKYQLFLTIATHDYRSSDRNFVIDASSDNLKNFLSTVRKYSTIRFSDIPIFYIKITNQFGHTDTFKIKIFCIKFVTISS